MAYFIMGNFVSQNKLKVLTVHSVPESLDENTLKNGYIIETISSSEQVEGKIPIQYYNTETNEIYYEYEDAPIDEMTALKNQLAIQEQQLEEQAGAIAELTTLIATMSV